MIIKEKKDSIDCDFYHEQFNQKQDYFSQLQNCVDHYIETFKWCNECDPWNIAERVNVQYYPPGAGYHQWHSERGTQIYPNCTRHLVFMTYLNDVTDGGETEFFYQNIKIKPEKGLTLIWPVDWTYTHRGVVSPSQEKYIITGWFNFVEKL